jgi:leucine-rich repeat protein SHOC2
MMLSFLYHCLLSHRLIPSNILAELYLRAVKLVSGSHILLSYHKLTELSDTVGDCRYATCLDLSGNNLSSLPDSFSKLVNLNHLYLSSNKFTDIPKNIAEIVNLYYLNLDRNFLNGLPDEFSNLNNLFYLDLSSNNFTDVPDSITRLINLKYLNLTGNQLTDLSKLTSLPNLEAVSIFDLYLPRRYWTKLSDWQPEWLLDEDNAEIRRLLIQQMGYEKICEKLNGEVISQWREYSLLKIDKIEPIYNEYGEPAYQDNGEIELGEAMLMLKMTCPSTGHIHILRVPPDMQNAEAAISWVNWGIHPDEFALQT